MPSIFWLEMVKTSTLESRIDVGHGITIGPGKFFKKNNRRPLNKRRAWSKLRNVGSTFIPDYRVFEIKLKHLNQLFYKTNFFYN